MWWLTQGTLAAAERQAIAELQEHHEWLADVEWRIAKGMRLVVDFSIVHEGEVFPLTMTYAPFYPNTPPSIVPRDERRLSGHQYNNGDLCLEYRADNWEPTITGAMMVESAHRLISGERGTEGPQEILSAHSVSLGQTMRGTYFRFLLTSSAEVRLRELELGESAEIALAEKKHAGIFTGTLAAIAGTNVTPAWMLVEGTPGSWQRTGRAIRLPTGTPIPISPTVDSLSEALTRWKFAAESQLLMAGGLVDLLLISDTECQHVFAYDGDEARSLVASSMIMLPRQTASRHPAEYENLTDKRVGIVGCGSLGSKIAVMLGRAGITHFTLIDDDLFMPENVVRNELGQFAIGVHKVDALEVRLREVIGSCDIRVRRVALGGQESADTTASVMKALGECDILVDATTDAQCFNFCAAVARSNLKPLVWAEVFGGGIGGMVVRARPGKDPTPQAARNQVTAWCEAQGVPALPPAEIGYGGLSAAGAALVADDCEVAVIASHTARFVVDALARPDASIFPASAYAIGFRTEWLFTEPYDTRPVVFSNADEWCLEGTQSSIEAGLAILQELMPAAANDDN